MPSCNPSAPAILPDGTLCRNQTDKVSRFFRYTQIPFIICYFPHLLSIPRIPPVHAPSRRSARLFLPKKTTFFKKTPIYTTKNHHE